MDIKYCEPGQTAAVMRLTTIPMIIVRTQPITGYSMKDSEYNQLTPYLDVHT